MSLPVSSRMASIITRTHLQRDLFAVATKAATTTASQFSTLTPKNLWMEGSSDPDSESDSRPYGTSSSGEDSISYQARWRNALHQSTSSSSSSSDRTRTGWTTASPSSKSSMEEFDPILSIRALNPLIFESNYDLEEYGPSFRDEADDHATVIQEWRIRHDNAV